MKAAHGAAVRATKNLANWTSHTVVVVDQSGSMRKTDADGEAGGGAVCCADHPPHFTHLHHPNPPQPDAMRADVVWIALAVDLVANRIRSGNFCGKTDVFSLVGMRTESAVLLEQVPVDWVLYNNLIDLLRNRDERPLGYGKN